MKETLIKTFKIIIIINVFLFCNISYAEYITVFSASSYPYKNLIERAHDVKIFYITDDKHLNCRVEIVLGTMKWVSVEKEINKELFYSDLLSYCLSTEKAEQILIQTFLQFGRGL